MSQTSAQKKAAVKSRAKQKARNEKVGAGRTKAALILRKQNGELQMALLNIRTMYDQKVMEVAGLEQQIVQRDSILTAACIGDDLILAPAVLELAKSGQFIGYDIDHDEKTGQITITVVTAEGVDDNGSEDGDEADK